MNQSDRQSPSTFWTTLAFAAVMAVLAGIQRYYPHPFNLTMIGALALWGGARLNPYLGLALPIGVWGATEVLELVVKKQAAFNPFVYASFLLYGLLGLSLRRSSSPARIGAMCVLGSVQFFLITNFSAWLHLSVPASQLPEGKALVMVQRDGFELPAYARNMEGLAACYILAVPFSNPDAPPLGFFGNALVGDLTFTAVFFGVHAFLLAVVAGRMRLQPVHERAS
jgi:hypothetical protein